MTLSSKAEMRRLYFVAGLSRMRIAKIFDCRVSEVNGAVREPEAKPLPPCEFADAAHRQLMRRSVELGAERKGKRRSVADAQNSAIGRRKRVVTLPQLSILEGAE